MKFKKGMKTKDFVKCQHCGSKHFTGFSSQIVYETIIKIYVCQKCGKVFSCEYGLISIRKNVDLKKFSWPWDLKRWRKERRKKNG